jgi:uncharacterized protein (DUF983 family)
MHAILPERNTSLSESTPSEQNTVRNAWHMCCPQCGEDASLDITVKMDVRLTFCGTDANASADSSHEWNDASACICRNCGCEGTVANFEVDEGNG